MKPGYLRPLVPEQAPEQPEPWTAVMADIERVIMSGVTHWHSPRFHAYFPTANSYPAIVADMLSGAIACIGFTWVNYYVSYNTTIFLFFIQTSINNPNIICLNVLIFFISKSF